MLSVLKRGVLLLDAGAGPDALDAAARSAITAFPGNESVRSIAVFAAVMSGDIDRAMRWGRDHLAESDPDMFAWVLLTSGEPVPEPGRRSDPPGTDEMTRPADEADPLFLVSLVEFAGPDDFLKAWRATGDWRYAADAAALRMAEGSIADAVEITAGASLALRAPLFAADIFGDAGDAESALDALRNAPREAAGAKLRMADALMSLGRFEEAESVYGELIASSSLRSEVPLVNMAWLCRCALPLVVARRGATGDLAGRDRRRIGI